MMKIIIRVKWYKRRD